MTGSCFNELQGQEEKSPSISMLSRVARWVKTVYVAVAVPFVLAIRILKEVLLFGMCYYRECKVFLVGGSIPEKKVQNEAEKIYNTCTVYNPKGK